MVFFFFKQKAAYCVVRRLVGSEMCIRGRVTYDQWLNSHGMGATRWFLNANVNFWGFSAASGPPAVAYTHLPLPPNREEKNRVVPYA